jgi:NDP-sugar pyrophosphorylase family protein
MKGFVLAAGFGRRMAPVTDVTPKPLLPIGNHALVEYAIALLSHHGIKDIIVNVHHLGDSIQQALGDGSALGVELTYSVEEEILGTGGGLRRMRDHLNDGTFVVVNSDTLIDIDLKAVLEVHRSKSALATLVLRRDSDEPEYGQIEIDGSGRVRRILGQGAKRSDLTSLMFTGVHVMEPQLLDYIPPDVETCVIRYGYTKALANNEKILGYVSDGFWADAGTPERYFRLNCDALERKLTLPHLDPLGGYALEPKRDVADVVRMGEDVELGQDVQIVPPVLLGKGVRVGDHATVGPFAIVGARAQLGRESKVSRSVVETGARVDAGEFISHSFVGRRDRLSFDAS